MKNKVEANAAVFFIILESNHDQTPYCEKGVLATQKTYNNARQVLKITGKKDVVFNENTCKPTSREAWAAYNELKKKELDDLRLKSSQIETCIKISEQYL